MNEYMASCISASIKFVFASLFNYIPLYDDDYVNEVNTIFVVQCARLSLHYSLL